MSLSADSFAAIAHLLPEEHVGAVHSIEPISMGLSGAGVYAVTTTRGELILRVQPERADAARWTQHLLLLRRVAERGIAPAIIHVDEAARAIVSRRVPGAPLPAALADPTQRGPAIASIVAQLQSLHAIDPTGIEEISPVVYGRRIYADQRGRPGFPGWAAHLDSIFDDIEAILERDRRRAVGHNDLNPGNILWDGARAWFVDWEVAGLAHPFYDLAVLALFLQIDDPTAHGLLAQLGRREIDDQDRESFAALRRLAAVLIGLMFLVLVPDLSLLPPAVPTLSECYAGFREGTLDLQDPRGRGSFALAILQIGTAG